MTHLWLSLYWEGIMISAGTGAIAALGLQFTLSSGQFSVMHAAIAGVGAYLAGIAAAHIGAGLWMTVALASVAGALVGAVAALLVMRLRELLLGVATLALGQIGYVVASHWGYVGASTGFSGIPLRTTAADVAVVLAIALGVALLLKNSRPGLALIAAGRDPIAAEALGIPVARIKVASFALGGLFAAASGALNAQYLGLVLPSDLSFTAEVQLILYVIIGGLTTPWGAIIGAFGIVIGTELLRFAQTGRYIVLGLVLTVIALVRPEGILIRRPLGGGPRRKLLLLHPLTADACERGVDEPEDERISV